MPNGYSVGNLELDITALDKSATSLNNVISRLQSMLNLVSPISASLKTLRTDMSAISRLKFGSFDRLAMGLNSLSKVNTQGLYTKLNSISRILTPLKELSASMTSIGSVNTFANGLQKITKLDVAGFDKQIKALTASLRPFLQEITVATPALTAFATAMSSVKGRRTINFKQSEQSVGGSKNIAKTLNLASIVGKIYFIRNYTKQLGQYMSGLVQSAIDYTETLNLWQVAMRGNIDTAEEFISKMNKAYGIAEQTLMRYQATFRNMLSTLGGVSTDVSYALSEYLTQMALDYASLYNTSIERAMTVFQSVLSGSVRPIRSLSGYDITETTIFELYQQLGGTKTMRQLTQTEKRLLRIYAVFQQMDRSGAIGDLNKTLNNTANQIRIMGEASKELGVWLGKLVEIYIAPMLPYLNAFLITAKNIAQAIVKSLPEYSEFDGTIKGYEETAEAMEQVNGKLLDFDKFRSLSGGEENSLGLGIDEKLIAGLTQYQSILNNVTNKATELAEKWTAFWVDEETGDLTPQAKEIFAILSGIAGVLGYLIGEKVIAGFSKLKDAFAGINTSANLLNGALAFGILYSFTKAIQLWKDGNKVGSILAITIGTVLVGAFVAVQIAQAKAMVSTKALVKAKTEESLTTSKQLSMQEAYNRTIVRLLGLIAQVNGITAQKINWATQDIGKINQQRISTDMYTQSMKKQETQAKSLAGSIGLITLALGTLAMGILTVATSDMDWAYKLSVIFTSLAVGITAAAIAMAAFQQNWVKAVSIGGMVAGGAMTVFGTISQFKNGGMPEKGTMFVAGEAGAEMVYNTPSGQSGVANISQIAQADYSGTRQALDDWWSSARKDIPQFKEVSGTGIYEINKSEMKRRGEWKR